MKFINKLRKRRALKNTMKMWSWLAWHPGASKLDYFRREGIITPPLNSCFACEYANKQLDSPNLICMYCPVDEWAKQADTYDVPCEDDPHSPFAKWQFKEDLSTEENMKYCMEIAKLCENSLKAL